MNDFSFFHWTRIESSSKDKYRPIWSKLDVTALKTEANECSQARKEKKEKANELNGYKHFGVIRYFKQHVFLSSILCLDFHTNE